MSDFIHMAQIADKARYPVSIAIVESGLHVVAHGPTNNKGQAQSAHLIHWALLDLDVSPVDRVERVIERALDSIDRLVADAR